MEHQDKLIKFVIEFDQHSSQNPDEKGQTIFQKLNEKYKLLSSEIVYIVCNLAPLLPIERKTNLSKVLIDEYLRELFNTNDFSRLVNAAMLFKHPELEVFRPKIIRHLCNNFQYFLNANWDQWVTSNIEIVLELLSQHSLNVYNEDTVFLAQLGYAANNNQLFGQIVNSADWNTITPAQRRIRLELFRHVYWNFLSCPKTAQEILRLFVHPDDIHKICGIKRRFPRRVREDIRAARTERWVHPKYGQMQVTMYSMGEKKTRSSECSRGNLRVFKFNISSAQKITTNPNDLLKVQSKITKKKNTKKVFTLDGSSKKDHPSSILEELSETDFDSVFLESSSAGGLEERSKHWKFEDTTPVFSEINPL